MFRHWKTQDRVLPEKFGPALDRDCLTKTRSCAYLPMFHEKIISLLGEQINENDLYFTYRAVLRKAGIAFAVSLLTQIPKYGVADEQWAGSG